MALALSCFYFFDYVYYPCDTYYLILSKWNFPKHLNNLKISKDLQILRFAGQNGFFFFEMLLKTTLA